MKARYLVSATVVLLLIALLYIKGFVGSSAARVAKDHSVSLPPSATYIRCSGPVSITTFGDFGADASFEMAPQDLPALISQFTWGANEGIEAVKRPNPQVFAPVHFTKVIASYFGKSRDGNDVWMRTYDLGNAHVGVSISTSWN